MSTPTSHLWQIKTNSLLCVGSALGTWEQGETWKWNDFPVKAEATDSHSISLFTRKDNWNARLLVSWDFGCCTAHHRAAVGFLLQKRNDKAEGLAAMGHQSSSYASFIMSHTWISLPHKTSICGQSVIPICIRKYKEHSWKVDEMSQVGELSIWENMHLHFQSGGKQCQIQESFRCCSNLISRLWKTTRASVVKRTERMLVVMWMGRINWPHS